MNWLTKMFRKPDEPEPVAEEWHEVRNFRGDVVCWAWKPDTWSISYLLWAEPRGDA